MKIQIIKVFSNCRNTRYMLSNGNAGLVQLNMSNVNGAAKNKLHEKWDTVKRKLGPLVKKSTSSPGKYFKSSQNYLTNITNLKW